MKFTFWAARNLQKRVCSSTWEAATWQKDKQTTRMWVKEQNHHIHTTHVQPPEVQTHSTSTTKKSCPSTQIIPTEPCSEKKPQPNPAAQSVVGWHSSPWWPRAPSQNKTTHHTLPSPTLTQTSQQKPTSEKPSRVNVMPWRKLRPANNCWQKPRQDVGTKGLQRGPEDLSN